MVFFEVDRLGPFLGIVGVLGESRFGCRSMGGCSVGRGRIFLELLASAVSCCVESSEVRGDGFCRYVKSPSRESGFEGGLNSNCNMIYGVVYGCRCLGASRQIHLVVYQATEGWSPLRDKGEALRQWQNFEFMVDPEDNGIMIR